MKLWKNKKGQIGPGMILGIVITSIVAFVILMVGIMVVDQTDTAANDIIANSGTANTTYEALVTSVWNAFGLYNVYPIILAAVGIIAVVGYLAYARAGRD